MARIPGVEPHQASPLARLAYFLTKRRLGRVIMPIRVKAHHPRLLRAYAHMEMGQNAAQSVPVTLKSLVQVKIAMVIGCPF